jgi:hypothetical protein
MISSQLVADLTTCMGLLAPELTRNFMLVRVNPLALASPNVDWANNRPWSLHGVLYRRFSPSPFNDELSLSLFYLRTFSLLGELLPFLDTFTILGHCPFHWADALPCPCAGERGAVVVTCHPYGCLVGCITCFSVWDCIHLLIVTEESADFLLCYFIFLPAQVNHAAHNISGSQDNSVGRGTRLKPG